MQVTGRRVETNLKNTIQYWEDKEEKERIERELSNEEKTIIAKSVEQWQMKFLMLLSIFNYSQAQQTAIETINDYTGENLKSSVYPIKTAIRMELGKYHKALLCGGNPINIMALLKEEVING